jgi:tryptophanyl-tRNA synthetase
MKRVFSGIQPTGLLHIGNYLGAIKQWVELQNHVDESIFCVVDLHAITTGRDLKLSDHVLDVAAWYLASGVDLKKSTIFVQSTRPEHSELAWILNCFTTRGELNRMTQFKEKSEDKKENVSVGLYNYPILMAADILLYQATDVPVGDDQKQHVELTRDIAQKVNNQYGDIFTIPESVIKSGIARVMGLDDPKKKMAKSAVSEYNFIALSDPADLIRKKVQKAVTDSGSEIVSREDKPAMSNLLNIFSGVTGRDIRSLEADFFGRDYGDFKKELAEAVVEFLGSKQKRYQEFISDKAELKKILKKGSEKIAPLAEKTLSKVKSKIGLGLDG